MVRDLVEALDSAALDSLKRAFGRWIYRSVIRAKRPDIRLPEIDDYHEVHVMLQQRVQQWNEELREQGRQQGLQAGRQEGRQEGRQQGHQEASRAAALGMMTRTNLDDATIAEITGLPVQTIGKLRRSVIAH